MKLYLLAFCTMSSECCAIHYTSSYCLTFPYYVSHPSRVLLPLAQAHDLQPPVTPAPTTSPIAPTMPTQCATPVADWMVAECMSYADGLIPPTPLAKRGAYPQETGMAINKKMLIAKGFVAGGEVDKRQTYYPDCGAPICFDAAGVAYKNKRDVVDTVAEAELDKRQTYYPDCGAPICFDSAPYMNMANKAKRDIVHAIAEDKMTKRQTYYPDCGAPICFDDAGPSPYVNKAKRDLVGAVAADELTKRWDPRYYPNCGAPICFTDAGEAYDNKWKRFDPTYYPDCGAPICFDNAGKLSMNEKRDIVDAIAEDELAKR